MRAWKDCPECFGRGEHAKDALVGNDMNKNYIKPCPTCAKHFKALDEAVREDRIAMFKVNMSCTVMNLRLSAYLEDQKIADYLTEKYLGCNPFATPEEKS